jgi:hypothetical protein
MASAMRNSEVNAVDLFLSEPKRLRGGSPQWQQSEHRPRELHAVWLIEDSLGIERAQLRFRCASNNRQNPSISLIFRSKPIWRVDLVPPSECKYNPPWARALGLPATVCGPHGHEWEDNRGHILKDHTTWDIPCRRPLPTNIRRLAQVLPWFASRISLDLLPEQRGFDVPAQTDLFGRG